MEGEKVFDKYFLRVRDKNSFGHSKISLALKEAKFENSKLGKVLCKISNLFRFPSH